MNRFPKKVRLHTSSQIKNVFEKRQKISQNSIAVFFYYNGLGYPRLGVVVPKKNIALAVQRNKVKRVIRESFRLNQEKIKNFDIIVFPYAGAEKITKKDLRLCLEKQWLKLVNYSPK